MDNYDSEFFGDLLIAKFEQVPSVGKASVEGGTDDASKLIIRQDYYLQVFKYV